ncbi:MAG: hypothetical protein JWM15_151 [Cryptosporangiaceae bacterium]|jgi:hypothetical protein|nr:hypothetical protein [Cryptosporangiaceae bacterium]
MTWVRVPWDSGRVNRPTVWDCARTMLPVSSQLTSAGIVHQVTLVRMPTVRCPLRGAAPAYPGYRPQPWS